MPGDQPGGGVPYPIFGLYGDLPVRRSGMADPADPGDPGDSQHGL